MSRPWTSANPGLGDPAAIRSQGGARRSQAADIRASSSQVGAASSGVSSGWQGQAGTALVSVTSSLQGELVDLAAQIDTTAQALFRYANDVESIQQQQNAIGARQAETMAALTRTQGAVSALRNAEDTDSSELYRAHGQVESLNWQLRGYANQLDALALQRSAADNTAITSLSASGAGGALAGLLSGASTGLTALAGGSPSLTLEQLAGMSATELAALFALYPGLVAELRERESPETVATWWASLPTAEQTALVFGAPMLIGSLGGVSPVARVAANRVNAAARIAAIDARIAELKAIPTSGGFSTPAYGYDAGTFDAEITKLTAERGYLQKAVDGAVQLYLYDSDTDSIIEMIGKPGPQTTTTITYVPGTYTSAFSFYGGGVQQVGRWLNNNDPNIVAFVWKVGEFPGEDSTAGGSNLLRIGEANDESAALAKGRLLEGFQQELHTASPILAATQKIGMGHSWGLPALTSSEVADAHYDKVISLAGAGMPHDWKAQPGTSYYHWSYTDALSMAQSTGAVWDGKIPLTSPDFTSHVYSRDGDFTLYLPNDTGAITDTPPTEIPASWDALGNHNLIASDSPENQRVLGDIYEVVK